MIKTLYIEDQPFLARSVMEASREKLPLEFNHYSNLDEHILRLSGLSRTQIPLDLRTAKNSVFIIPDKKIEEHFIQTLDIYPLLILDYWTGGSGIRDELNVERGNVNPALYAMNLINVALQRGMNIPQVIFYSEIPVPPHFVTQIKFPRNNKNLLDYGRWVQKEGGSSGLIKPHLFGFVEEYNKQIAVNLVR